MKHQLTHWLSAVILLLAFTACSDNDNHLQQGVPFKSEKGGNWGMITSDGKVLFEEEFDNMPTIPLNDRFFVKNKDEKWEIYSLEEKPKTVGTDCYKEIAPFVQNVTPAVKEGKPVCLIDKEGKEVKVLDKLGGATVEVVTSFTTDGYANYITADEKVGLINTKGDVVIKADYCSLYTIRASGHVGIKSEYKKSLENNEREKIKYTIFNIDGKEEITLSGSKYSDIWLAINSANYIVAQTGKDDDLKVGLLDRKGEWVLKPSSKVKSITGFITDDVFIFYNGEHYGVMNTKGEVLIRAKYAYLKKATADLLFAQDTSDRKKDMHLINLKDEQQGEYEGRGRDNFFMASGEYAVVRLGENEYCLINNKGEEVKDFKTDIYEANLYNDGNGVIHSDYVDISAFVESLNIRKDGIGFFNFGLTPKKAVEAANAYGKNSNLSLDAKEYVYTTQVKAAKEIMKQEVRYWITYGEGIAKPITRTVYVNYYGYSFPREETVGYEFKNIKPQSIMWGIAPEGKLAGKKKELFNALCAKAIKLGKKIDSNKGAMVVDLSNGNKMIVCTTNGFVFLNIIKKDIPCDISEYDTPDFGKDSSSNSNISPDADAAEADDVLVDSVAA